MNNPKILIVTECFYPEEFHINDLASYWNENGYDVDVLTLFPTYPVGDIFSGYRNRLFAKENFKGINIYRVFTVTNYRSNRFKKILKYISFMFFGTIAAIVIGKKYDYIFGFNVGALTDMFPAVVIKKIYKKPLMLWVQDIWPDSIYAYGFKQTRLISKVLNIFVKFIFHNVSSVAISCKGFETKLKPYAHQNVHFNYLPNWAISLINDSQEILLSKKHKVHFTFAGNIGKVQNLENIINAFNLLSGKYQKKAQLNIIGDGSNLKNIQELARNNKSIVFYGKKNQNEMSRFYIASDFLIVSLIDEPIFSLTVPGKTQTYIAAKKPILGIINGDTAEIIKKNNLGLCAPPSNIDLIYSLMKDCIDMTEEQKAGFVKNNDFLLNSTFNKEKIIKDLTRILVN